MMNPRILLSILTVSLWVTAGCQPPEDLQKHTSILKLQAEEDVSLDAGVRKLASGDHLALIRRGQEYYTSLPVKDYTCLFVKQERMGGSLKPEQNMKVRFRAEPFSVGMIWTKNAPLGDALVFVEGNYKDKNGKSQMVVHPRDGVARFLVGESALRLPDGADAMRETRKPCTSFGFANAIQSLIDVYEQADKNGDLEQAYGGVTEVDGRPCVVLVRTLSEKDDYPAKITEICLDAETFLPLRIVGYDWKNRLDVNYEYHQVKFNKGLADGDFTPEALGIKSPKK